MLKKLSNDQNCDWFSLGQLDTSGSFVSTAGVLTVRLQSEALVVVLNGAKKAVGPPYFGQPPDETKPPVNDTMEAARALKRISQRAEPCTTKARPGCAKRSSTSQVRFLICSRSLPGGIVTPEPGIHRSTTTWADRG